MVSAQTQTKDNIPSFLTLVVIIPVSTVKTGFFFFREST
jgi:hypothetical protein